jgi:hypothetical protein
MVHPPHAPYHPGPVPRSTFWLGSFQLVFFRLNLRSTKPFTCAIESEPFTCASAPELLVQLFVSPIKQPQVATIVL